MPPTVLLETAGTHSFDLAHMLRSGAQELVQQLLEKAGFKEDAPWRVRIDKKQPCSGLTSPVSVTGYKMWGISIRIKPGDNNTCHTTTIMPPPGLICPSIYRKIKAIEKSFNRNWRKKETMIVTAPAVNGHKPVEIDRRIEEKPIEISTKPVEVEKPKEPIVIVGYKPPQPVVKKEVFNTHKYLGVVDNVRYVLLAVQSLEQEAFAKPGTFSEKVLSILGIPATKRHVGQMLRSCVSRGWLRNRPFAYKVTSAGIEYINSKAQTAVRKTDRAALLRSVGEVARDITDASSRLVAIHEEKIKLQESLKALESEEAEICSLIENVEVEDILSRLATVQKRKVQDVAR